MSSDPAPERLALQYFDGRHARAHAAQIRRDGDQLVVEADGQQHRYPLKQVAWPERQRHGQRLVQLPDGGVLNCPDAPAWDAWAAQAGLHEPVAVSWAQSWRHVLSALLLLVGLLWMGWKIGIPLAAEGALALIPAEAEGQIGTQALESIDRLLLKPSALPAARRGEIEADFARLVRAGRVQGQVLPDYHLHFRAAGRELGPNALALPGGHIVLTDALAELLADQPDALVGVLAHELGHVQGRHGLRMAVQTSLVGALAGLVVGDFSTVLAGIPTLLGQQAYSRDFEREADAAALRLLRADGRPPRAMLVFFERIEKHRHRDGEKTSWPTAISSHPADEERMRFFSSGADSVND